MITKLKLNNKIIINTDIDGIISGLLLSNFCDCIVVGFSNSLDKVWLDISKCSSIFDGVYVDMYVPNETTITIDQHIIAVNDKHFKMISQNRNKINPNIYNPRFFLPIDSYKRKYPFGTCHFIIATLLRESIDVSKINFFNLSDKIFFIDYFLRADDAMISSLSNYKENAKEWWEWLSIYSNKSKTIESIKNYLYSKNIDLAMEIKKSISNKLLNTFYCDRQDGGITNIIDDKGTIKQNVKEYIHFISSLSNLNCFDINLSLKEFKGLNKRTCLTEYQREELIQNNSVNGEKVFSYAFVKTAKYGENFSYTVMDNK
mgnify:CR=1 FL=1